MDRKYILSAMTLALVLTAGLATGCSHNPFARANDPQIVSQVQGKLYADSNITSRQIQVQSQDGVVTLSGPVASADERQAAAMDAAQVPGVKTVVNNLQVQPMATTEAAPPPAPGERSPAIRYRPRHAARERAVAAADPPPQQETQQQVEPQPMPQPQAKPAPPPPPPAPEPVTLQAGTTLYVRMRDGIDSSKNVVGDVFHANLDSPITVGDEVVLPAGAEIVGRVAEDKSAGHFAGRSQIALELTRISYNGHAYSIATDQYTKEGNSRGKRTAATVGGGSALGAIIGAIAGGGKGAAIGAVAGAGAGTAVQGVTKGQQVKVEPEAVLAFRLESPLTATPSARVSRHISDSDQ